MPSLDSDFEQLASRLDSGGSVIASRSDPFYYFVYHPSAALEVRRRIPVWSARLQNAGLTVERVSFPGLLWSLVDASGRWDLWLELEEDADQGQTNNAIRDVVSGESGLIRAVGQIVGAERPNTVVFLTETELLHPYFRVRVLESALHDQIKVPTVIFYPGRRSGQYGLRFLDLYPEDGNYRATIIGGLP